PAAAEGAPGVAGAPAAGCPGWGVPAAPPAPLAAAGDFDDPPPVPTGAVRNPTVALPPAPTLPGWAGEVPAVPSAAGDDAPPVGATAAPSTGDSAAAPTAGSPEAACSPLPPWPQARTTSSCDCRLPHPAPTRATSASTRSGRALR